MNADQLTEKVIGHTAEIAAVQESVKSAHRRIDENDRITEGIHKLCANVETLALQVKHLAEKVESSVARLEQGLQRQGERIGALEKEPGEKWKAVVKQILITATTAGVTYLIARLTG